ncbi:MAG: PEP-CTERM sorting domain-containing protein [Armatimonadetes bacterium]|nr:PEP-CTERM sorting domain-containing protein [Armatimonadota bacterium]
MALLAVALVAATQSLAVGPTSMLYAVEVNRWGPDGYPGYPSGLDMIQGGTLTSSSANALSLDESAIAVSGDVRTLGVHQGEAGSLFDLSGNVLDHHAYTTPPGFGVGGQGPSIIDATSDGLYNYGVDLQTGNVIRMDRDWTHTITLFSTNLGFAGISMNVADGSFWVCGQGDRVAHFSHGGAFISDFHTGLPGSYGLALDPADGTLWMQGTTYTHLAQYDQLGHRLQNVSYDIESWDQNGIFGMEFNLTPVTPEPASICCLALGSAALLRRRRNQ